MKKVVLGLVGLVAVVLGALALGVGAAAPPYVSGKRVAPAVPADILHIEGRLETKDGLKLLVQRWRPQGETKGAVVIVHGLKDYSDRYADFAVALARRGWAVHALDLRGHGDSEGDRVWVDRFDEYVDDLGRFMVRVEADDPGKPLFLFGHSMGGAIVTLYTLTQKPKLSGLITSGAALKRDAPAGLVGVVKFFSVVAPKLAVFELDDSKFSRDASVVAAMKTDPLIYDGKAPARTAAEVIGAIDRIREASNTLSVPLLAMHGSADVVTPPDGSKELVEAAASKDKTFKSWDGLYHDLLHEPERQQVVDAVLAWLDAHTPTPAAPELTPSSPGGE
jgi:alpha-beta hydrolase superfamily lysophospholipase